MKEESEPPTPATLRNDQSTRSSSNLAEYFGFAVKSNDIFLTSSHIKNVDFIGSARQGWVVESAPTDPGNSPTNGGVISTHLPIKLLSLASPSRHLDLNQNGKREERMLRRSQTEQP